MQHDLKSKLPQATYSKTLRDYTERVNVKPASESCLIISVL